MMFNDTIYYLLKHLFSYFEKTTTIQNTTKRNKIIVFFIIMNYYGIIKQKNMKRNDVKIINNYFNIYV